MAAARICRTPHTNTAVRSGLQDEPDERIARHDRQNRPIYNHGADDLDPSPYTPDKMPLYAPIITLNGGLEERLSLTILFKCRRFHTN
jgi:hypothetical protein